MTKLKSKTSSYLILYLPSLSFAHKNPIAIAEVITIAYQYTSIPINENALKRIHKTRKQALLETEERQTNLRGAFEAFESECSGKAVLLIDDVCTTGSTLRECARELKIKGATHVYALVFALSKVN